MNKTSTEASIERAPGDPTRDLAFGMLLAVLERRRALDPALDEVGGSDGRDRAAAHRLAATVLRRSGTLDAVLEPLLSRAPPSRVRLVLWIGAAQLLLLDTPPHAAVATAVALARRRGLAPFAGLVNAVLRRVATQGAACLDGLDTVRLDIPAWLWRSWASLAPARVRAIAAATLAEAPLDLTLRPGCPPPEGGARLPTGSVRYPPGTRPTALAGFATGEFWVQDAAAALPARLLRCRPGEHVADLCAAPGGKTAQLAASGAMVTAIDRDPRRLDRLRANLGRLAFDTVTTLRADVLDWRPQRAFDAILLDAPCSATGTLRRHPDGLRTKREAEIDGLAAVQDRMIAAACAMLRPGGRLVYAVCSMQPQEGEARIACALAGGAWDLAPFDAALLGSLGLHGLEAALTPQGALRTDPALWPEHGGMDGFFVAALTKR